MNRTSRTGRGDVLAMLVGTVLVGLSGYLFLALIGHGRFGAATTAALSATYLLGNVLGPGVFIAVEQETSRVVSDAIARKLATAQRVRHLAVVDTALAIATLLVLAACASLLLLRVLDDQIGLIVALALAVVGSAAVYFVRGLTGGQRRFRRYALTVVLDGVARIVGCGLLVVMGSTDPVAYGLALCAGPAVAALLTGRGAGPDEATPIAEGARTGKDDVRADHPDRRLSGTPAVSSRPGNSAGDVRADQTRYGDVPPDDSTGYSRLGRDVGLLLIASALAMALANLAPVVVTGMLTQDPAGAAGFAGAVVLTRVPLLFMGPIQAMLLPGMTAAAAAGDRTRLRATIRRGLMVIGVLGIVAVVGTAVIGRPVIALLLGAERDTTGSVQLVILTASAVLFMAVQLLQPALVALRRHRALVGAWIAGAVAFTASFLAPIAPLDRGLLAQLAGPTVTLIVQLAVLARARPTTAADATSNSGDFDGTTAE